ncbi:MAG TPA: N-acetyltransferase [Terriglobia bacterium]|nr:N-acetyltransferase [Terriglobia bacterium]
MPDSQVSNPHRLGFIIRDYLPSEFDLLWKIDGECFSPEIAYSQEELADFIGHPDSHTWVAEGDGAVAGFLVATRVQARRLHIVTLDVVKSWRRRGVGRALMRAAENLALLERRSGIVLETAEDNFQAQAFYHGLGFQKARRVSPYYSDGTAAWVMFKKLT